MEDKVNFELVHCHCELNTLDGIIFVGFNQYIKIIEFEFYILLQTYLTKYCVVKKKFI